MKLNNSNNSNSTTLCAFAFIACLICILLSVNSATCMSLTDLDTVRRTLLVNVTDIPSSAAGYFFAHGSNAVPLIVAGTTPVAMAATYNSNPSSGKICAFGHNGYATTSSTTSSLGSLLVNCAKWASGNKQQTKYLLHGVNGASFYNQIPGFVQNKTTSAFDTTILPLETVDLVIMNLNSVGQVTPQMQQMMDAFLARGGGIIVVSTAWAHSLQGNQFPGNVLFAKLGVSFYTYYFASGAFVSSLNIPISDMNPYFKLVQIENQFAVNASLIQSSDVQAVGNMLSNVYATLQQPISPNSIETIGKAKSVYESVCTGVEIKFPVSSNMPKLCIFMIDVLNEAKVLPIDNNPEVLAGEQFPGLPNNGLTYRNAPTETLKMNVSTNRKRWQCTGFYALPGATLEVILSNPKGVSNVRIGGHTDGIAHLDSWSRWPSISKTFSISATTNSTGTITCLNGGTIYIEVSSIPLSVDVTVIGQVVKTPFFKDGIHTDQEWNSTIRNYPGPWVEIESEHFAFNVQATPTARQLSEVSTVAKYWGNVVAMYYELSQRQTRDYKERMQADIQISAGYMHSGLSFYDFSRSERWNYSSRRWGHYHELGHNFQEGAWTYDQSGEVTCNIFSLYLEEHYPDSANTYGKGFNPPRGLETTYKGNTQPFKGDWTSAGLLFYLDLIQAFGWVAIRKTFVDYQKNGPQPQNDDQKRDQWMTRFSKVVGRNLGPFCDAWSFPVSDAAKASISNLTAWMPNDMIVGCGVAPYEDSPCASLDLLDTMFGKDTTYQVKITTWTPVRHFYGEKFVFTFSGSSIPLLNNGTLKITMVEGTALNSTAIVSNSPKQGTVSITIPVVEFMKSGQTIKFTFQAKNNPQIGSFITKIKVLDQKGTLVNTPERPLEFVNAITLESSNPMPSTSNGRNAQVSGALMWNYDIALFVFCILLFTQLL
ncbi:predicted protein [Naegleria gruberi]|uniref:Predicted protein n=1 Tax=Naegleria gruberi TaxID=5762 RepID=D2VFD2_NAEGR|nr:uncharacterized protein NAEGRDRAFT_67585 [Naegleria gruberi]EFC44438.1 predicted protein [Naegleria gruberi]|eukprot:XP_002677182.1 predicted protein [Naegleria gruberi strain NEG-M]